MENIQDRTDNNVFALSDYRLAVGDKSREELAARMQHPSYNNGIPFSAGTLLEHTVSLENVTPSNVVIFPVRPKPVVD